MRLLLLLILASIPKIEAKVVSYYGADFFNYQLHTSSPRISPEKAKRLIRFILFAYHEKTNAHDNLYKQCPSGSNCYRQRVLDYSKQVRPLVMAEIHSFTGSFLSNNSARIINTPYCNRSYKVVKKDGRYQIPSSNNFNVEHTFPQRRFNPAIGKEVQKSDLHNLWPVLSKANSVRSSFDFSDLPGDHNKIDFCPKSEFGRSGGSFAFEPPNEHKGDVARAALYFALRYDRLLSPSERETYLRWNKLDPVDENERKRMEKIFIAQKNRNPFIDYPHLVNYLRIGEN